MSASMTGRPYSFDAPDQGRLKLARVEIEAILRKHDLAGVVVLHTPGMAEFFYDIRPSYSVCWLDEKAQILRMRSRAADYGGDTAAQRRDQAATANMAHALFEELWRASRMFAEISVQIDTAAHAEHTAAEYVPDPREGRPS